MAMLVLSIHSVFLYSEETGMFGAIGLAPDVRVDKVRVVFQLSGVRILRFRVVEDLIEAELALLPEYRKCVPDEDSGTFAALIETEQMYVRALHYLRSKLPLDRIVALFGREPQLMELIQQEELEQQDSET
jgi:hypothetical protein